MTGVILSDYEVNDILNEQDKEIKLLKQDNEKLKQQRDFYYARLQKIIRIANGDVE